VPLLVHKTLPDGVEAIGMPDEVVLTPAGAPIPARRSLRDHVARFLARLRQPDNGPISKRDAVLALAQETAPLIVRPEPCRLRRMIRDDRVPENEAGADFVALVWPPILWYIASGRTRRAERVENTPVGVTAFALDVPRTEP
jgi:hypothetical protein